MNDFKNNNNGENRSSRFNSCENRNERFGFDGYDDSAEALEFEREFAEFASAAAAHKPQQSIDEIYAPIYDYAEQNMDMYVNEEPAYDGTVYQSVSGNGDEKGAEPKKGSLFSSIAKKLGAAVGILVLAVVALVAVVAIYLFDKVDLVYITDEEVRSERLLSEYQEEFFESTEPPSEPGTDATEVLPEIVLPEDISSVQTPDVINVILVGTDERTTEYSTNSRGDSITIVSIDTKNMTLKLASMRRELPIPTAARGEHPNADILTSYYSYYREQGVMDFFEEYLGVHIDYYVRVNFSAFVSIVDRMGGVDVNLSWAEANYMNTQTLVKIDPVEEGQQHLDGNQALIYARIRKIDSNRQRVRRQRTVLAQLADKGSSLSLADLNDVLNSIVDAVQTDMPEDVIIKLLTLAPSLLKTDLSSEENYISIPYDKSKLGDYNGNSKLLREFLYGE